MIVGVFSAAVSARHARFFGDIKRKTGRVRLRMELLFWRGEVRIFHTVVTYYSPVQLS